MQDVAMRFQEKLRILCARDGLNQSTLVEKLDGAASKSTVSNWFVGKHVPPLDVAFRLSRIFGVPLDVLADENAPLDGSARPVVAATEIERTILTNTRMLGEKVALKRILGSGSPILEPDDSPEDLGKSTKPETPQTTPHHERGRKSGAG